MLCKTMGGRVLIYTWQKYFKDASAWARALTLKLTPFLRKFPSSLPLHNIPLSVSPVPIKATPPPPNSAQRRLCTSRDCERRGAAGFPEASARPTIALSTTRQGCIILVPVKYRSSAQHPGSAPAGENTFPFHCVWKRQWGKTTATSQCCWYFSFRQVFLLRLKMRNFMCRPPNWKVLYFQPHWPTSFALLGHSRNSKIKNKHYSNY